MQADGKRLLLGSLFDGSGGFPLAGALAGIVPVWAAEIEPYPVAVTRSRFPWMRHLGSVTEINGAEIQPVDIITFGSPCQDMSVAGKRAGMKHEEHGGDETTRSGLFYEAVRIIREMREATNGQHPTFAVWENVPGAFTSNGGEDFRCVLEELSKVTGGGLSIPGPAGGKWKPAGLLLGNGFSIAWRVFDAQYWGVPQRRRRIYLVADFGGGRAGKILFERDGLRRDSAPGGETGEETAENAGGSTSGSHRIKCMNPWDVQSVRQYAIDGIFPTLQAHEQSGRHNTGVIYSTQKNEAGGNHAGCLNPWDAQTQRLFPADSVFHSLSGNTGGGMMRDGVVYTIQGNIIDRPGGARCNGSGWSSGKSIYTLNTIDRPAVAFMAGQGQNVIMLDCRGNGDGKTAVTITGDHENRVTDYSNVVCMGTSNTKAGINQDISGTLLHGNEHPIIVTKYFAQNQAGEVRISDVAGALNTNQNATGRNAPNVVCPGKAKRRYIVRRLTPLECCRLQGFPDGWGETDHKDSFTNEETAFWHGIRATHAAVNGKAYKPCKREALVKWYNELHTDSAEYKMWGNGIALPCARYVMEGIAEQWENEVAGGNAT